MSVADSFVNVPGYEDGGYKIVVVAGVLIVMQFLMVSGRFVSRRLNKCGLGADDYVLFLATGLTMGLCAIAITFPKISLSQDDNVWQMNMAWMITYGLSIGFSKCAILLLYVRVFTTQKRGFTIATYVVGFVVIATALANVFTAIFQCTPQAFAWDKSIPDGRCLNIFANAQYMAIPNVVTGALMLAMPMPLVWNLKIDVSAKIALTATFLHGIIGFIASCARLTILFSTNTSSFSSNTSLVWTIWTVNEPANYIIAACLPTLRPIFVRVLPSSFFLLSRKRNSGSSHSISAPKVEHAVGNVHANGPIVGLHNPRNMRGEEYWNDVEMVQNDNGDKDEARNIGYAVRRSLQYDLDKKLFVTETTMEIEGSEHPCFR